MRIGRNELQILELLAKEENGLRILTLRETFDPGASSENFKRIAFSRAVNSLAEKGLIAKYALFVDNDKGWSEDGWTEITRSETIGLRAIMFRKDEDILSKPADKPTMQIRIGLTGQGEKELHKREDRMSG